MKRAFVIVSLLVHVAVGVGATQISARKKQRRATAVAVVNQKEAKKAKPKEPPKPPPPPPPPKKAVVSHHARKAAPAPTPEVAPPAPAPRAPTGPAFSTGLTLSNSGPGIDVGTNNVTSRSDDVDKAHKPAPEKTVKELLPKEKPKPEHTQGNGDEECTEEPSKPSPVSRTEIGYTDEARANGVEGRLVLRVTVDKDGSVTRVEVLSSVDPSLDAAAIAAVKQWRFKPAMACGKPVAGATYTLARIFELGD